MSPRHGTLAFELSNDLAEMSVLADHLEEFGTTHGIAGDVLVQVNLALDEIVSHVIAAAHGDGGDHRIRISLVHDGRSLVARIEDDGAPRDRSGLDDSNLGMPLARTLMDDVSYSREHQRNILVIRKETAQS